MVKRISETDYDEFSMRTYAKIREIIFDANHPHNVADPRLRIRGIIEEFAAAERKALVTNLETRLLKWNMTGTKTDYQEGYVAALRQVLFDIRSLGPKE